MPELPEVEVTRRGLAGCLDGARIDALRLGAPLRWPLGIAPAQLVGATLGAMTRRGKYLWLPLAGAEGASGGLLLHLGMSGSLALQNVPAAAGKHDHFDLVTSRGTLRLTDPRRFGAVVWAPAPDAGAAGKLLARLGHEPFDPALDGNLLHARLRRRRCTVKAALLGGDVVVGAGNIYACEALFDAGVDPRMRCSRLSRPGCERLLASLRRTLARALELGGSTLRDYRDVNGAAGGFQLQAQVYGRAGQPCLRCGSAIRRVVQAQRATFFCPGCQRR